MIRALVFDFDGLILDTEMPELIAWRETFSRYGSELTLEAWIDCVGRPAGTFDPCEHLESILGRKIDRNSTREETKRRARELIAEQSLRPGVADWLSEARRLDLSLGISSSSSRRWVEGHLDRLGVRDRFEALVCFEDVERHKPDPEPYLKATKLLEVSPEQAIAIEDSSHGLRSARAAGLWCIAVPNEVTSESVAGLAHVDLDSLEASSLEEILRDIDSGS